MPRRKAPKPPPNPFRWFDSSPEVIRLVVMLYGRYPLSLRNVEGHAEAAKRGLAIHNCVGDLLALLFVYPDSKVSVTPTMRMASESLSAPAGTCVSVRRGPPCALGGGGEDAGCE